MQQRTQEHHYEEQNNNKAYVNTQGGPHIYPDDRHAEHTQNKKKPVNSHYQQNSRDKKTDMQIVTMNDPHAPQEYSKPRTSHSTRNSFTVEPRKMSLKHPESTKNTRDGFKSTDFQNEQTNSFQNQQMAGAQVVYNTKETNPLKSQGAPRASSHQHLGAQAQDDNRRSSQNQNMQNSQQHSGMRQPHQPHQQQATTAVKRNDSGRRGVQQKGQIVPGSQSQQYQYQLQMQMQQQQQIEQQIRHNQKQELVRLEQQQKLQEQLIQQQRQGLMMVQQQSNNSQQERKQQQTKVRQENKDYDQKKQQTKVQDDQNTAQPGQNAFSSLVCQVPQGAGAPVMPIQPQSSSNKQVRGQMNQQQKEQEWLIGPQLKGDIGRKTLVLDLDETLVHSQFKPVENADIILPVEIEGQICQIYILVRPGVSNFLKRMSKHYEMVVFTASLSKYAEPLVAQLDPDGFCNYKLFREHCTFHNNAFVKDLTRLGREMTDVIIVDNSPIAFMFQPENAIPCISWYEDMSDTELDRIATILEKLAYEEDVRKVIRKIIKNNTIDDRAEQIYLQSQKRDHSQKAPEARKGNTSQSIKGTKSHQRYESADNRQKHQAVIQDKIRRQQADQQFTMTDNNIEDMMRQMKVHRDNYVDEFQQQANTLSSDHSGKKKRTKPTQGEQISVSYKTQHNDMSGSIKQERVQTGKVDKSLRNGSKDQKKKLQTQQQQFDNSNYVQMVYHPMTTKGGQHFNFDPQQINNKQQNTSPVNKRSTSVKNANQPQILKQQQVDLAQYKQNQAAAQRQRGLSAQQQNIQVVQGSSKSKQNMVHSGSTAVGSNQGHFNLNTGQQRSGSGQRKKVSSYSNFMGQSSKVQNSNYKTQGSTQLNNSQHVRTPSGSNKSGSQQFVNLSQSQRLNIQNYSQSIKASSPTAAGQRQSHAVQNTSTILKQSIKDFQDMMKLTNGANHDQRQLHPSLNQVHISQHGPALTIQPQAVSSTKAAKKMQSPSNYASYSQREDAGFLNKLSNQQKEAQMQQYARQQVDMSRGMPPHLGTQSHAPYPAVISLNSPKYAQPGSLLTQAMAGGPHYQMYENPQFNRTGPVIVNNTRPEAGMMMQGSQVPKQEHRSDQRYKEPSRTKTAPGRSSSGQSKQQMKNTMTISVGQKDHSQLVLKETQIKGHRKGTAQSAELYRAGSQNKRK